MGIGYWVLGIGYWLLVIGYWLLGVGCCVLGCRVQVIGYWYWVLGGLWVFDYLKSAGRPQGSPVHYLQAGVFEFPRLLCWELGKSR
jgi:hypothetical protein